MTRRISWAATIGVGLALAVAVAGHVARTFDLATPTEFNEGPMAATVARWQQEPLGPEMLHGPRLTVWAYGPGFHAIARAAAELWPGAYPVIPGRVVSLLAVLATAGLLIGVVRRQSQSWTFGLAAAVFYLAAPICTEFGDRMRVDALAVFFGVAACAAAQASGGASAPRVSWLALSAVLVMLGSLVKQTAALAAGPVVLWLLLEGRWRAAGLYGGAVAALGAAAWLALDVATGGLFLRTAVGGQVNHMDWAEGLRLGRAFLGSPFGPAAAVSLLLLVLTRGRAAGRELSAIAFVVNVGLMTLLAAKDGSSAAYFLEASALGAWLIAGVGLPDLSRRAPTQALVTTAAVCLLAAVPAARDLKRCALEGRWRPASPVSEELRGLISMEAPGSVLADPHALDDVVSVGRDPLVNDPYLFRLLADNGGLSPESVVRALADGSVPYVVLSHSLEHHRTKALPEFPRPVLEAVAGHYRLMHQGERLYVYRFGNE